MFRPFETLASSSLESFSHLWTTHYMFPSIDLHPGLNFTCVCAGLFVSVCVYSGSGDSGMTAGALWLIINSST